MAVNQALEDRPKINELQKYMMFTETPGSPGKRAKLVWSIRDGSPRISVYTNDPADVSIKGPISCPMNPETFFLFLNLFEGIIKGENNAKNKIDCYASRYDAEGKPTERYLSSSLLFGKDQNGLIWISALTESRPKIKFEFQISDYHKIFKSDGSPFNPSEASCLQAMAVKQALFSIYTQLTGMIKPYSAATSFAKSASEASGSKYNKQEVVIENDMPF